MFGPFSAHDLIGTSLHVMGERPELRVLWSRLHFIPNRRRPTLFIQGLATLPITSRQSDDRENVVRRKLLTCVLLYGQQKTGGSALARKSRGRGGGD